MAHNSQCMLESLLKVKKDFQKTFKNLICFFFLLQPVPFYGQNYEKQKGPGFLGWKTC